MNSSKKAYLFAGLAVFFWSTVATAFKIALREFDFIQLIFYASAVTVVLLFFVLLFQQKLEQVFRQTPQQWLNSIFIGAFNPLLYYLVSVSYTHLRAHETKAKLVCRLLLEKKKPH